MHYLCTVHFHVFSVYTAQLCTLNVSGGLSFGLTNGMATIFPQEQHLEMKVMEQPYL